MGIKLSPLNRTYPHSTRCFCCRKKPLRVFTRFCKLQPRVWRLVPRAAAGRQASINGEHGQPHSKFTKEDLQRIKEHGPSIEDLKQQHEIALDDGNGLITRTKVEYISPQVLGTSKIEVEPKWEAFPQMNVMQFYHGLRERNWRSEYFKPDVEPWRLQFFVDSGRLFRPSYSGYRVLVTPKTGNVSWVNLPVSGNFNFLEDAVFEREFRDVDLPVRTTNVESPKDCGYNQVIEQLHYAFEERLQTDAAKQHVLKGWISPVSKQGELMLSYDCPGQHLLDVSFHLTPNEPSLHTTWDILPSVLFVAFAFSFLGVCLTLGIFAPRKQMPTDPMQAMEFAQSKGKARMDGRTDITFDDVAGLDSIVGDLKDIVNFLREPSKYAVTRAQPPKGVLLEGPPGTGKTLIAKAIAGEAGVPFYQMSGSEFVEAIVGVGAARVRDLFKRARAQDEACIVFVDEIDALGIKRAEAGIQTNEEREQTLNQLLTEMDGFSSEQGVVFVGATNRADLLDPALTRAGRFDRKIRVSKPDTEARYQILKVHARRFPTLMPDVDLLQLARDLPGLSGAELANILNEAALAAVRRDADEISRDDVYSAVDRILQGIRHPIHPRDMDTIGNVIAGHEMGRAIVAYVLRQRTGRLEAVERISMVPRGKDWSRTIFFRSSDEEYTMSTKAKSLERLRVILGGRAAEDLLFEDPTTYGNRDLEAGYNLATKIISNYGLSTLGITTYAPAGQSEAMSNRSFEVNVDNIDEDLFGKGIQGGMFQPSNYTKHETRKTAHRLMAEAYQECLDILSNYMEALSAGSSFLLDQESITGKELAVVIGKNPPFQTDEEMMLERAAMDAAHGDHTKTASQAVSLETKGVSNMLARNTE